MWPDVAAFLSRDNNYAILFFEVNQGMRKFQIRIYFIGIPKFEALSIDKMKLIDLGVPTLGAKPA